MTRAAHLIPGDERVRLGDLHGDEAALADDDRAERGDEEQQRKNVHGERGLDERSHTLMSSAPSWSGGMMHAKRSSANV